MCAGSSKFSLCCSRVCRKADEKLNSNEIHPTVKKDGGRRTVHEVKVGGVGMWSEVDTLDVRNEAFRVMIEVVLPELFLSTKA
ncbi:hypothetical protein CEXT_41741 [Caerostris extrusa]|uniref:Uncharacterized protein n=1 Tax=Caerostris extrusa TaxID=172846 RepID=A0AAV4NV94_CAEEX|nr:hypothetical protein CEXT_41741 [Caerostris extrusa]